MKIFFTEVLQNMHSLLQIIWKNGEGRMKMNVKELAKEQESYVIQCRHYLHSHPELSTKEVNTTRFIKEELEKMGVEVQEFEGITGCVGTIKGDKPGKDGNVACRY